MAYETMGTSAAQLSKTSRAQRGRLVPKGHGVSSSNYPESNKANKGNIYERQGATLAPVMSHYQQNCPEASSTGRNVYTLPSVRSKNGQFSGARVRYY